MLTTILISGIASAVAVLALALLMPAVRCERCRAVQPRFRVPGSKRQALLGGSTCASCGTALDRRGRAIT